MGYGQFDIGNNVIVAMNLAMKVSLQVFVPPSVINDPVLQQTITDNIIVIIENAFKDDNFNLAKVAETITTSMSDYCKFVNILGINDQRELQTLIKVSPDIIPTLAQELYLTKNNEIWLKKALDIEFIKSDD
jgi:hypothetical protein